MKCYLAVQISLAKVHLFIFFSALFLSWIFNCNNKFHRRSHFAAVYELRVSWWAMAMAMLMTVRTNDAERRQTDFSLIFFLYFSRAQINALTHSVHWHTFSNEFSLLSSNKIYSPASTTTIFNENNRWKVARQSISFRFLFSLLE